MVAAEAVDIFTVKPLDPADLEAAEMVDQFKVELAEREPMAKAEAAAELARTAEAAAEADPDESF